MSDLFNQSKYEEYFDAEDFFRSLCKSTKIQVSDRTQIQFLSGWKVIVEKLVQKLKNYPIHIIHFNDHYSMLDIEFSIMKQTREVNIWRAISDARQDSQQTCAMCGAFKRPSQNANSTAMFCKACIKNVAIVGKTETWLDKY